MYVAVGSVLLMDEAQNGTVPLLANGGHDVSISMDGVVGDKQRYQQQLQLIDEQVNLVTYTCNEVISEQVKLVSYTYNEVGH